MDATDALLTIALAVLMALTAVGGVLFIKMGRRSRPSRGGIGEAVPARPMSRAHARRLQRNYFWTAAVVVAALAVFAVLLYFGGDTWTRADNTTTQPTGAATSSTTMHASAI
ncbi:MAG: hypothetical protein ACLGI7_00520 [Gammaproteobacteria bacterium]